jgi:hypothetical protein
MKSDVQVPTCHSFLRDSFEAIYALCSGIDGGFEETLHCQIMGSRLRLSTAEAQLPILRGHSVGKIYRKNHRVSFFDRLQKGVPSRLFSNKLGSF